jgi:hypothetical protein
MGEQPRPAPKAIELRVEDISQLFHTLDPFPFREKDLDKDVEEFIVSWAREMPEGQPLKIVVHLPETQASRPEARELDAAGGALLQRHCEPNGRSIFEAASDRSFDRREPDAVWLGRELETHRNISVRLVAGGSST